MSETDPTHDDHATGRGSPAPDHGHGHASADAPLGQVDGGAWASAILGGSIGLVVAVALAVATRG